MSTKASITQSIGEFIMQAAKQLARAWFAYTFGDNPLVTDTGPYLQKVAKAIATGFIAAIVLILLAMVFYGVIVWLIIHNYL